MSESLSETLPKLTADHLRKIASLIPVEGEIGSSDFTLAVQHTLRFCGVDPADMAGAMGVTIPTILRWEGGFVPTEVVHLPVLRWIAKELRERADEVEAFPTTLGTFKDDYTPSRYLPLFQ